MRKSWSEEETNKLISLYEKTPNLELDKIFPDRTRLSIYKKANKLNLSKNKDIKFIDRSEPRKREKGSNWNGGRMKTKKGYILVLIPEHHRAEKSGYVMEHIVEWEKANGKTLPEGWVVHHINRIKDDNRPENLVAMTFSDHVKLHNKERRLTDEAKSKISEKAKKRLSVKSNHPMFKENIDIDLIQKDISNGMTTKEACKKQGIEKTTYYRRLKWRNKNA